MRRIGISNLAWQSDVQARLFAMLAEQGAEGIEVAPTRIAPWDELGAETLAGFRRTCSAAGLQISSLQAIFYLKPEASLLGDAAGFAAMEEHVRKVAGIAAGLGAGVAVFGAPRSRLRGTLSSSDAMTLGAERLRRLGDLAAQGGLVLGMEPVPPVYGADFLNHAAEMIEIVTRIDHPNIRAHLDTACVQLAGDDIATAIRKAAPWLAHYHMAEPQLGRFENPTGAHELAGTTLDEIGYSGWVVVEMREIEGEQAITAAGHALAYARANYGGAQTGKP